MNEGELAEIEKRCLWAQADQSGTLSFNALLESARDVPALILEVRRLKGYAISLCEDLERWCPERAGYARKMRAEIEDAAPGAEEVEWN